MQHRLVVAEKVLLQETLIGCIKALVDILAITNPVAFGRSARLKRLATGLAEQMGMQVITLSELVILMTAREWTQDYEWYVHFDRHGQPDDDYLRNRVARLTLDLKTGAAQVVR